MSVVVSTNLPATGRSSGLRLIAYDHRALVEIAERLPWSGGHALARERAKLLEESRPCSSGFGAGEGDARHFDVDRLSRVRERLEQGPR